MYFTTKAQMTKSLKSLGIRTGEKGNSEVKLEHMKYEDLCKLFDEKLEYFVEHPEELKRYGTGNAEYWSQFVVKEADNG